MRRLRRVARRLADHALWFGGMIQLTGEIWRGEHTARSVENRLITLAERHDVRWHKFDEPEWWERRRDGRDGRDE